MSDQASSTTSTAPPAVDTIQMTRDGYQQLEAELSQLTQIQRPALVQRAQRARLFLTPAVGVDAHAVAQADLDLLDRRIKQLTDYLERVQVIDEPMDTAQVHVGSRVTVRRDDGTEETLTIVGPYEADPTRGYVASDSPPGAALVGQAPGAKVTAGSGEDSLALTIVTIAKQDAPAPADAPAEAS